MREFATSPAPQPAGPVRAGYDATRDRVETYFDKTATQTWERLTSDAPVSKIRETVRQGRDQMRALMLNRLPVDLSGQRVLDAGCGTGQMATELAARGAEVLGVDVSPQLIDIAELRLPEEYRKQVRFAAGDMLSAAHGHFDHVIAMDSLIYYDAHDIGAALKSLENRTRGTIVFTIAPRTRLLMAMWYAGKLFPRSDRSPIMVPHAHQPLAQAARAHGVSGLIRPVERITSGFYISQAMEVRS
ncbi:magnesium protoporphyrin IX methyltransferase [uncultured Roseobacter sp.]|uniref:magnesium protoporphyrin IX methyltransferase n=1 Tax=uncultured Roseobacter sp. TaxID=114847 RepID=UPI00261DB709|nr:magnesium protoporphyrin IX methyltransferase [uncultured Roseobacter sp.]